jgi:hypothetical protein
VVLRVRESGNDLVGEKVPLVSALIDQVCDHRLCHHFQTTRGPGTMRQGRTGIARTVNKSPPRKARRAWRYSPAGG